MANRDDVNLWYDEEVGEMMQDVRKLVEDRNALIKFYFGEDKYKDFLLAERLQDLAALDSRDDSTTSSDVNFDKKEVNQTSTYFRKFSNFLNPGDLPAPDLDPITFSEDVNLDGNAEDKKDDDEEDDDKAAGTFWDVIGNFITGGKSKKGGGGGTVKSAYGNTITPTSSIMGGAAAGSPAGGSVTQNLFNSPSSTPKVESLKESGFEEGVQKNISDKFNEDLGIDPKLKEALSMAMASPLQAVAGGLMSLLAQTPVKSNEQKQDLTKNISFISNAFGIPSSTLENVPDDPAMLQAGVNNATPAAPSPSGMSSSMSGGKKSGGGRKWWNPFTWFGGNNDTGDGSGGPDTSILRTSAPITNNIVGGNSSISNVSNAASHFSPSAMARSTSNISTASMNSESSTVQETNVGNSFTDILNSVFGGDSSSLATNVFRGGDGHVHTVQIGQAVTSIQDRKPDLMTLTNNVETQLSERRAEQTTTMASTFAAASSGMSASPPPPAPADSLMGGGGFSGDEEHDDPFFDVFASTNQYA